MAASAVPMGDEYRTRLIYILCAVAFTAVVFSLLARDRSPAFQPQSSLAKIQRYARDTLAGLQEQSIERNQEYCGVIYEDEAGALHTSEIYEGKRAECEFDWGLPLGNHVVASFHTHGGYDFDYDSEVPSVDDLASDVDARIGGFVSTPGGRLWYNDWQEGTSTQLCGEGCLAQDRRYVAAPKEDLALTFTIADLQARGAYGTQPE
ncbi:DUF4329 domain-containing protein [Qipengyuania flava]|nr:DUF4329 domain-containing protein [Qipengyuania flava]